MALEDDISSEVNGILAGLWTERDGNVVPDPTSLRMYNDGVWLDSTILYADIADSTVMVDTNSATFCAEVYKCFLHAAGKIIRSEGGVITAYDGDRVMAIFIGEYKNTRAVRAALKVNYARKYIINPAITRQYQHTAFELGHVVGVDTSRVMAARIGVRGANDLVWVGRAANHAAKMASLSSDFQTRISSQVYDAIIAELKTSDDGRDMWERVTWTGMNREIYRSKWSWVL